MPNPSQVGSASDVGSQGLTVFLVAGEHSGDAIGGKLMHALNARFGDRVRYLGVGGHDMEREGLTSLFPLEDVAVMGPLSILKNLPTISRRVYQTIDAAVAAEPDVVVIIDAPEFTHPIAKRIRKRAPSIPIIDYVSPSIWAWRPGRARKMKPYVDHVLALLPFEPDAHVKLGGPPCTYVGHPLAQRADWLRDLDPAPLRDRLAIPPNKQIIAVLPGSRASEVTRLMVPFGETIAELSRRGHEFEVLIPVVKHLRSTVEDLAKGWPVTPHILEGDEDKFRAFKASRAALAASGTVTLELAMAGTPMVVAYRVDGLAAHLRFLMKVHSIVLANLVLAENAFPEYIQEQCTAEFLAPATEQLLSDTPARISQLKALTRIPAAMAFPSTSPSEHAAQIVADYGTRTQER